MDRQRGTWCPSLDTASLVEEAEEEDDKRKKKVNSVSVSFCGVYLSVERNIQIAGVSLKVVLMTRNFYVCTKAIRKKIEVWFNIYASKISI